VELGANAGLSFNYHMFGAAIGTLQVKVVKENTQTVVWEKTGQQGNKWNTADVSLNQFASDKVEIIVEGIRGGGWQGDIAIDAIRLNSGSGLVTAATPHAGSIIFQLDSPAGQVDVAGLTSIFGALRLQLSPTAVDIVKSEEGESALLKALFAIFGKNVEIIGTCDAGEAVGAQCPSTRSSRNLTSSQNLQNVSKRNSSLHVDFRIKIKFGDVEDASGVLSELSRIEAGDEDALDEAAKEVEFAFNSSAVSIWPVTVLRSPQPMQLKYKSHKSHNDQTSPSIEVKAGKEENENEINTTITVMFGAAGGCILLSLAFCSLVVFLLVRRRRVQPREAQKNVADTDQKADANTTSATKPTCLNPQKDEAAPVGLEAAALASQDASHTNEIILQMMPRSNEAEILSKTQLEETISELSTNSGMHCGDGLDIESASQPSAADPTQSGGPEETFAC